MDRDRAARSRRTGGIWTLGAAAVMLVSLGAGVAYGAFSVNDEQKFVPYGVFGTVTASCPHGQHVNFGGFKTDTKVNFGGQPLLFPASTGPEGKDTNKWSSVAASPRPTGRQAELDRLLQGRQGAEGRQANEARVAERLQ